MHVLHGFSGAVLGFAVSMLPIYSMIRICIRLMDRAVIIMESQKPRAKKILSAAGEYPFVISVQTEIERNRT